MDEIVNKVAQSALMVFDLEDYYPDNHVVGLDISQWLLEGVLLKETDFKQQLKTPILHPIKINMWRCIVLPMPFYPLGHLLWLRFMWRLMP